MAKKPTKKTSKTIKSTPKKKSVSKTKDDCPDGVCPIKKSKEPESLSIASRFLNLLFPSKNK